MAKAKRSKGTKTAKAPLTEAAIISKIEKAPVANTKAKSKKPEAKLDEKNAKTTVKQVVKSQREIKYLYPADVDNTLDRKAFRQKVRNEDRRLQRQLNKVDKKDTTTLEKLQAQYSKFRTKHYTVA